MNELFDPALAEAQDTYQAIETIVRAMRCDFGKRAQLHANHAELTAILTSAQHAARSSRADDEWDNYLQAQYNLRLWERNYWQLMTDLDEESGFFDTQEDAIKAAHAMATVMVREGWHPVGQVAMLGEFTIYLSAKAGPEVRIYGELIDGKPSSMHLEYRTLQHSSEWSRLTGIDLHVLGYFTHLFQFIAD